MELKVYMAGQPLHANTQLPVAACHVCGATFKTKRYLKHHTRRVHCDPVRCDLCPKELSNKKQLTRHVKRVHLKREVSNCRICGKTLKSIPGLKNHEMKCGGA